VNLEPSNSRDDTEEALLVRYPSRGRDLILTGLLAVVGVLAIVLTSGELRNALCVLVIVLLAGLFGIARSGIRCDALGIARLGGFSSRRFPWSEIERIEAHDDQGIGVRLINNGGWVRFIRQSVFGPRTSEAVAQLEQQRNFDSVASSHKPRAP
jgi:hypothetical protein